MFSTLNAVYYEVKMNRIFLVTLLFRIICKFTRSLTGVIGKISPTPQTSISLNRKRLYFCGSKLPSTVLSSISIITYSLKEGSWSQVRCSVLSAQFPHCYILRLFRCLSVTVQFLKLNHIPMIPVCLEIRSLRKGFVADISN